MNENLRREIEARYEKFKREGLTFLREDGSTDDSIEIFQDAFTIFINNGTPDEVQRFIAQIPNIQDHFDLLQNNGTGNLCASILASVNDTNLKTTLLQVLFDAGIEYSFLKSQNGTLFLYSDHSDTRRSLDYIRNVSEICLPYLKAILYSKNYHKFTEAVEDLHLEQSGFRNPDSFLAVVPSFINAGVEAALEYLRDNPIVGEEVLKPFYNTLTNPEFVLGNYCSDIQQLANENRKRLEIVNISLVTTYTCNHRVESEARTKSIKTFETLQAGVETFKEEFLKNFSLLNIARNTINGVIKDKKSIEELPIPASFKNTLTKGYHNIIHPGKRETYQQEQGKLDQLAKFKVPQISTNKGDQTAKNKTQSKQDLQDKNIIKRSRSL